MQLITDRPEVDWRTASRRISASMSTVRTSRQAPRTSGGESASRVRRRRWVEGQIVAMAGSLNILLGRVFSSRHRTAYGHRLRVVGTLQRNCEVDRRTAHAFVDRWLSRHAPPPV